MVAPLSLTSHKLKTCVFYVPSYKDAIDPELQENWVVVAEGIQTILRREG